MENKQIEEIIDYLASGEKFQNLLLEELKKTNLEEYERKTYTSLLDALLGSTELCCSLNFDDEDENANTLRFEATTKDEANRMLNGMILQGFRPVYDRENTNLQSGNGFTFRTGSDEEVSKYRDLFIKSDSTVYISKEY